MTTWQELIAGVPLRPRLRTPAVMTGRRDADGNLIVPASRLSEDERAAVVAYLRLSPIIVDVYGYDRDPYQPGQPEMVPLHVHTDGVWAWSESVAYYAQRYGFAPDPALLEHIRRRSYRWPDLPEETLIELSGVLREQTSRPIRPESPERREAWGALKVVGTADAERLFTVVRDSGFGWTAAEVSDLLRALGWPVVRELPGMGTVARPPWDLPRCEARVTYHHLDGSVASLHVNASAKTDNQPVERLAIADGFASLVAAATRVLGPPTSTLPGAKPTARWRGADATLTIHAFDFVMTIDWVRNEYADSDELPGDR